MDLNYKTYLGDECKYGQGMSRLAKRFRGSNHLPGLSEGVFFFFADISSIRKRLLSETIGPFHNNDHFENIFAFTKLQANNELMVRAGLFQKPSGFEFQAAITFGVAERTFSPALSGVFRVTSCWLRVFAISLV